MVVEEVVNNIIIVEVVNNFITEVNSFMLVVDSMVFTKAADTMFTQVADSYIKAVGQIIKPIVHQDYYTKAKH